MKHYFAYRTQSKPGLGVALYHGNNPEDKSQERYLGPQIVASHEIPEGPLHDAVERGDCPWEALRAAFPPPAKEQL